MPINPSHTKRVMMLVIVMLTVNVERKMLTAVVGKIGCSGSVRCFYYSSINDDDMVLLM